MKEAVQVPVYMHIYGRLVDFCFVCDIDMLIRICPIVSGSGSLVYLGCCTGVAQAATDRYGINKSADAPEAPTIPFSNLREQLPRKVLANTSSYSV